MALYRWALAWFRAEPAAGMADLLEAYLAARPPLRLARECRIVA
jgi:hypothetical protein